MLPRQSPSADHVILVDQNDNALGTCEKLEAHRRGLLHRAVSAFVFDGAGRHLLQRRAEDKYHSAGLWSNACCSHPRPDESVAEAVGRRLREEMGIVVPLLPLLRFTYHAKLGDGIIEHEVDHLFIGTFDASPAPDPAEVSEWRWIAADHLEAELALAPENFTSWFRILLPEVQQHRP